MGRINLGKDGRKDRERKGWTWQEERLIERQRLTTVHSSRFSNLATQAEKAIKGEIAPLS